MILKARKCNNCSRAYSGLLRDADTEFCCDKCRVEYRHKEMERRREERFHESEFRKLAGALPESVVEQMRVLL
jgi:hypothetical protein